MTTTNQPGQIPVPRPAAPQLPTNTMALVSLVSGIAGALAVPLCCCSPLIPGAWMLIFGLPAVITGWLGRGQILASNGQERGENLALAGLIMGIVEVVLALFFICLMILAFSGSIASPVLEEFFQNPPF